jgi:hypothetical protein
MERYLPILKEAAGKGELKKDMLAIYIDRIKMYKGEKQIYGSQIIYNKDKKIMELYPVEDEATVNDKRAEVGLDPLREYLEIMGVPFDADTVGF